MRITDFLATLPPVADDAREKDRDARRNGTERDPFGTPEARALAPRLVSQYETTAGPQDLDVDEWPPLMRQLRNFPEHEWAALQRNRAAPPSTTPPSVEEEDSRPARSPRKKSRAE